MLENYHEDDVVEGRVTKVVTFGAFVEILPGVEGLVHISELAQHHVENPREVVSQGQPVNVKIIEVDGERRRLSLSLKRVEDDDPVQPRADGARVGAHAAERSTCPRTSSPTSRDAAEPPTRRRRRRRRAEAPSRRGTAPRRRAEAEPASRPPTAETEAPAAEASEAVEATVEEPAEEPAAEEPTAEADATGAGVAAAEDAADEAAEPGDAPAAEPEASSTEE